MIYFCVHYNQFQNLLFFFQNQRYYTAWHQSSARFFIPGPGAFTLAIVGSAPLSNTFPSYTDREHDSEYEVSDWIFDILMFNWNLAEVWGIFMNPEPPEIWHDIEYNISIVSTLEKKSLWGIYNSLYIWIW